MNLAIDIGNTSIKAGLFIGDKLLETQKLENEERLPDFILAKKPDHVIVSSVRKDSFIRDYCTSSGINIIHLDAATRLPFRLLYQTPGTLGADRMADVAGAMALYPGCNCLAIDAGTCITYDIIDKGGNYHGGGISPGLQMRLKALNFFTGKLPLISPAPIDFNPGKSTEQSILSGVMNGILYEVQGFIDQYSKIFSQLNVIITGGDSYCFESRINRHIFVVPNLLLLGLNNILLYNLSESSD